MCSSDARAVTPMSGGSGMGNDVTDEEGTSNNNSTDVDSLVLAGLNLADVKFIRMPERGYDFDLMIKIKSTGEWIILDDQLSVNSFESIERIEFSYGTVLTD